MWAFPFDALHPVGSSFAFLEVIKPQMFCWLPPYTCTVSAPCFCVGPSFRVRLYGRRVHWALEEGGSVSLCSSDLRAGTLPKSFPGPPLVFSSSPFGTFYLCFIVVVVLATCQAPGKLAEQERHAFAVPFFPRGSVFLPSEESVLRLDRWPLSLECCLGFGKSYGLTPI